MMRREYIQVARNIWPGIAFQEVPSFLKSSCCVFFLGTQEIKQMDSKI
jgi:hypothetical protein